MKECAPKKSPKKMDCETVQNDALGDLMDRYVQQYKSVSEAFAYWKPYILEYQFQNFIEFVTSNSIFGFSCEKPCILVVSYRRIDRMAFCDCVRIFLPDLEIFTSKKVVEGQSCIYVHHRPIGSSSWEGAVEKRNVELCDANIK